jgi:hypothetical protein
VTLKPDPVPLLGGSSFGFLSIEACWLSGWKGFSGSENFGSDTKEFAKSIESFLPVVSHTGDQDNVKPVLLSRVALIHV